MFFRKMLPEGAGFTAIKMNDFTAFIAFEMVVDIFFIAISNIFKKS